MEYMVETSELTNVLENELSSVVVKCSRGVESRSKAQLAVIRRLQAGVDEEESTVQGWLRSGVAVLDTEEILEAWCELIAVTIFPAAVVAHTGDIANDMVTPDNVELLVTSIRERAEEDSSLLVPAIGAVSSIIPRPSSWMQTQYADEDRRKLQELRKECIRWTLGSLLVVEEDDVPVLVRTLMLAAGAASNAGKQKHDEKSLYRTVLESLREMSPSLTGSVRRIMCEVVASTLRSHGDLAIAFSKLLTASDMKSSSSSADAVDTLDYVAWCCIRPHVEWKAWISIAERWVRANRLHASAIPCINPELVGETEVGELASLSLSATQVLAQLCVRNFRTSELAETLHKELFVLWPALRMKLLSMWMSATVSCPLEGEKDTFLIHVLTNIPVAMLQPLAHIICDFILGDSARMISRAAYERLCILYARDLCSAAGDGRAPQHVGFTMGTLNSGNSGGSGSSTSVSAGRLLSPLLITLRKRLFLATQASATRGDKLNLSATVQSLKDSKNKTRSAEIDRALILCKVLLTEAPESVLPVPDRVGLMTWIVESEHAMIISSAASWAHLLCCIREGMPSELMAQVRSRLSRMMTDWFGGSLYEFAKTKWQRSKTVDSHMQDCQDVFWVVRACITFDVSIPPPFLVTPGLEERDAGLVSLQHLFLVSVYHWASFAANCGTVEDVVASVHQLCTTLDDDTSVSHDTPMLGGFVTFWFDASGSVDFASAFDTSAASDRAKGLSLALESVPSDRCWSLLWALSTLWMQCAEDLDHSSLQLICGALKSNFATLRQTLFEQSIGIVACLQLASTLFTLQQSLCPVDVHADVSDVLVLLMDAAVEELQYGDVQCGDGIVLIYHLWYYLVALSATSDEHIFMMSKGMKIVQCAYHHLCLPSRKYGALSTLVQKQTVEISWWDAIIRQVPALTSPSTLQLWRWLIVRADGGWKCGQKLSLRDLSYSVMAVVCTSLLVKPDLLFAWLSEQVLAISSRDCGLFEFSQKPQERRESSKRQRLESLKKVGGSWRATVFEHGLLEQGKRAPAGDSHCLPLDVFDAESWEEVDEWVDDKHYVGVIDCALVASFAYMLQTRPPSDAPQGGSPALPEIPNDVLQRYWQLVCELVTCMRECVNRGLFSNRWVQWSSVVRLLARHVRLNMFSTSIYGDSVATANLGNCALRSMATLIEKIAVGLGTKKSSVKMPDVIYEIEQAIDEGWTWADAHQVELSEMKGKEWKLSTRGPADVLSFVAKFSPIWQGNEQE